MQRYVKSCEATKYFRNFLRFEANKFSIMGHINKIINEIAEKKFNDNNSKFAEFMDTTESNIRNYRKNTEPKLQFIINLSEKLAISYEELLGDKKGLIPFYEVNTEAGVLQASNMDAVIEPTEWIDAGDWFRDADCAMRVHGDSMFPLYKSGSIVVMREVQDKSLILYGQDYVIQTSEYRVIKRIQKSTKGYWLACSVNEDTWEKGELAGKLIYEPFEIAIDSVNKIFRVLGCVNRTESSRIVYTVQKNV